RFPRDWSSDVCSSDLPAGHDLVDHLLAGHRTEGVEDRLAPRRHLLALGAGQVAELLAPDGEERAEHHDLLVLPTLERGLQPGTESGRAARRDGGGSTG